MTGQNAGNRSWAVCGRMQSRLGLALALLFVLAGGATPAFAFPSVVSVTCSDPTPTNESEVHFAVSFSEGVTGVDVTDFTLIPSGIAGASITGVTGSDIEYSVAVDSGTGNGTLQINVNDDDSIVNGVSVPLGGVGAGNGAYTLGEVYTIDKTAPDLALLCTAPDPFNTASFVVFATFTEDVTDFEVDDVTVVNGTAGNFLTSDAHTYRFDITPSGQGEVRVSVGADVAEDAAGNGNTAASSEIVRVYDSVRPGVALSSIVISPTNTSPIGVDVVFTEDVTGFDEGDLSVTNASVVNFASTDGSHYSFELTPSSEGTVSVSLGADKGLDDAGNGNTASNSLSWLYDSIAPQVVSIVRRDVNPSRAGSVSFGVTISEAVTGVDNGDFAIDAAGPAGASVFGVIGSGTSYTVTVLTGTGDGTLSIDVPNTASFQDASGNVVSIEYTSGETYTIDKSSPTVAMSSVSTSPTNDSPISVLVVFSEDVIGFDVSDISATNGTIGNFEIASASGYRFELTPGGDGTVIANIGASAARDAAWNQSLAAPPFSIVVDTGRPSVTLGTAVTDPTRLTNIGVSVVFSEDVADFVLGSVSAVNGTLSDFSATDARHYSFVLHPTSAGTTGVNVNADVAHDAAGNGNTAAAGLSLLYDPNAPSVVSVSRLNSTPTRAASVQFSVVFSEPVTGVNAADFAVDASGVAGASVSGVTGSGTTYTVTVSTGTGDGTLSVDVLDDDSIRDAAGNPLSGGFTAGQAYTLDRTSPTVVMSSTAPSLTKTSPIPVTVTFSEDVTGFAGVDISPTNGTVGNFAAVNARTYTFNLTPSGQGVVSADIGAGAAADGPGNGNLAAERFSRTYDSIAPAVVSVVRAGASPTNGATVGFTVTFSETVTGVDANDFQRDATGITGAAVSGVSGSGTTYTVTLGTGTGDGSLSVDVLNNGSILDLAGNGLGSPYAAGEAYTVDKTAPTVHGAVRVDADPTRAATVRFSLTFSEVVSGVDASDLAVDAVGVTGAAIEGITGSGTSYTVTMGTGSGDGTISFDVLNDGSIRDVTGNLLGAGYTEGRAYTIDKTNPTLTLQSVAPNPTRQTTIPVVVEFNEAVTGFEASDLTLVNATVSGFTAVGVQLYSFNLVPSAQGVVSVSVAAGVAQDATGNGNAASSTLSRTYDTTGASVVSVTQMDPVLTNQTTVRYAVTFSENVTGVDAGDFSIRASGISGASVQSVLGANQAYIVTLNTGGGNGQLGVNVINNGTIIDGAGNALVNGFTGAASYTIDKLLPLVQSVVRRDPSPTNAGTVTFGITFSENVTGVDKTDFSVGLDKVLGGEVTSVSGSGRNYVATVTTGTGDGFLQLDVVNDGTIVDSASNVLAAEFTSGEAYTLDRTAPTVAMSSMTTEPTNSSSIVVTAVFSEAVTGFVAGDVTVANGALEGFTALDALSYRFTLVPDEQGVVTADIAAGAAADAAGNLSSAAARFSRTFDSVAPGVTLTTISPNPTNTAPINVTTVFSEGVTGFVQSDLVVTNATVSNFVAANATTYTFSLTPSAQGTVSVRVPAGAAEDAAANVSMVSATLSRTYDSMPPTVTLATTAVDPTNATSIPVTVVFSEDVGDFVAGDVTVVNGTVKDFSGTGKNYAFSVTPAAQGQISISLAGSVAHDTAGNGNAASAVLRRTYDGIAPTVTMNSTAPNPTKVKTIPVTVTFSEAVTGFAAVDVTVVNAVLSSFTGSGTSYSFTLTASGDGQVSATINGNVAVDAAGNGNAGPVQLTRDYDGTTPAVTVNTKLTNDKTPELTGTVSEPGAAVSITVGSQTVAATNTGTGTWVLADNRLTELADGVYDVRATATDAAGNAGSDSTRNELTVDTVAPVVTVAQRVTNDSTPPLGGTVNDATATVRVTVGNQTLTAALGAMNTWQIADNALTVLSDGVYDVQAVATDLAGNIGRDATTGELTIDTSRPSVVLTTTAPSSTNVNPLPVTATFSEAVTGFVLGDITVTNGTARNLAGSGSVYTFEVAPGADGTVSMSVAQNVAQDAAGNQNTASAVLTRTVDLTPPSVTIGAPSTTMTSGGPVSFMVTYQDVTTVTLRPVDVVLARTGDATGTVSIETPKATLVRTVVISNISGNGTIGISLASGTGADNLGNLAPAVGPSMTFAVDNLPPTVTLTSTATEPTNATTIPVTATFSEVVTGFSAGSLSVENGTIGALSGNGAVYTFEVIPGGPGVVSVTVAADGVMDAAGNGNLESAALDRTYDAVPPPVSISAPHPLLASRGPVVFTVSYDGATAITLDPGDVTVNRQGTVTVGSVAVDGTGVEERTVTLSNIAGNGLVSISIAAGTAVDRVGNVSPAAGPSPTATIDNVAPTLLLETVAPEPTNMKPMPVVATFSEVVTGFALTDLQLVNATANTLEGSGNRYTFNLVPSADGLVTVTVPAGSVTDAAGNANTAGPVLQRTYETVPPSLVIAPPSPNATNVGPVVYSFTYQDAKTVTLKPADITLIKTGTANGVVSVASKSTKVVEVTVGSVTGDGTLALQVAAGTAVDAAGNLTPAAGPTQTFAVDNTKPVISMNGEPVMTIGYGSVFIDPGARATDTRDGDITLRVIPSGVVNTSVVGDYTRVYTVSDAVGNTARAERVVHVVDRDKPVITRTGAATMTVECGGTFNDPGVTASDPYEGNLTTRVVVSGDVVDIHKPGTYVIRYNVHDTAGNVADEVRRTVNVVDTTVPVIALQGGASLRVECGADYVDPGFTATDTCAGDISDDVVIGGDVVNPDAPGVYTLTYDVVDGNGNAAAQVMRTVEVADATAPVIALQGSASMTIECGSAFTDPGARATDTCAGDLSGLIAVGGDVVNPAEPGTYTITYNVSDPSGNPATQVTRTVEVADRTAPVITLHGDAAVKISCDEVYVEAGAEAQDTCAGDISDNIKVTGSVQSGVAGEYTLTYTVSDVSGNAAAPVQRLVTVEPDRAPVITLKGDNPMQLTCNGTFTDPGFSAEDACGLDLTAAVTVDASAINSSEDGAYPVTYRVSDGFGHSAEVTRTVVVANCGGVVAISGVVRDLFSQEPLEGALVKLSKSGTEVGSVNTDEVGSFFLSAPAGSKNLTLDVSLAGYESRSIVGLSASTVLSVHLALIAPSAPQGVTGFASASDVALYWKPNPESDLQGYNVYRQIPGGSAVLITTAPVAEPRYVDTGFSPNVANTYTVTAVDTDGHESAPSAAVIVRANQAVLWMPNVSAPAGTEARVPLSIANAGGISAGGISIDLRFPAELVNASGIRVERTPLTESVEPQWQVVSAGLLRITTAAGSVPMSGAGHLFDVYLPIPAAAPADTCGFLQYAGATLMNTATPAQAVLVDFSQRGTLCVSDVCVQGDLDNNGVINRDDVSLAQQLGVGLLFTDACMLQSGDIDGNYLVDTGDAVLIYRLANGLDVNPDGSKALDEDDKATPVVVSLGSETGQPGKDVQVPLVLKKAKGVTGLEVMFTFPDDPSLIAFKEITPVGPFAAETVERQVNAGPGWVMVSFCRPDGVTTSDFTAFEATFTIAPTAALNTDIPVQVGDVSLRGTYGQDWAWSKTIQRNDGEVLVRKGGGMQCLGGTTMPGSGDGGALGDMLLLALAAGVLGVLARQRRPHRAV